MTREGIRMWESVFALKITLTNETPKKVRDDWWFFGYDLSKVNLRSPFHFLSFFFIFKNVLTLYLLDCCWSLDTFFGGNRSSFLFKRFFDATFDHWSEQDQILVLIWSKSSWLVWFTFDLLNDPIDITHWLTALFK